MTESRPVHKFKEHSCWGVGREGQGLKDRLVPDGQGSWEAARRHLTVIQQGAIEEFSEKEGCDQICLLGSPFKELLALWWEESSSSLSSHHPGCK